MINDIYKYLKINDSLATSGQPSPEQFVDIAKEDYELIINLSEFESTNAIYNEGDIVKSLSMDYIHIPVRWRSPKKGDYETFANTMGVNQGKKTFIHCAANKRVSIFLSIYRLQILHEPRHTVLEDIAKIWQPNTLWQTFFETQLETTSSETLTSL